MAEAPDTHPSPRNWWAHVLTMSYLGMIGLVGEAVVAYLVDGGQGAGATVRALGWVALATTYGAGTTLIDAIQAWRGNE